MPIYEYICAVCHTKFEAIRPISEANSPIECCNCKSVNTKRVQSTFFARNASHKITQTNTTCNSCI